MKILICIGRLYMGGIEKYAVDLALGLKAKGHYVSLLIFYNARNTEKCEQLRAAGIDILELRLQSGKDFHLPIKFLKVLRTVKPEVVHFNILPILAFFALSIYRIKTVYTIHQITGNKIISGIYKFYLDGIIAISKNVKSIFHTDDKVFSASQWEIINNGIELGSKQIGFPSNNEIRLIMVSRLAQDKHPDDAIEIINYLTKNSDLKYKLILVGDGDVNDLTYVEDMCRKVKDYGIQDNVSFEGWKENVNPYLYASHGFLMLSRLECFPYSVLEALSVGLPVFSYRIRGGLHDMHENKDTGIVVNSRNPVELAKQIDKVFHDNLVWKKYSDNAFAKSKNFSISQMVNKTELFYQKLSGQKIQQD